MIMLFFILSLSKYQIITHKALHNLCLKTDLI